MLRWVQAAAKRSINTMQSRAGGPVLTFSAKATDFGRANQTLISAEAMAPAGNGYLRASL